MRTRIDPGASSALALCGCGDRFLALTKLRAYELLAAHEARVHPDDDDAREGLRKYRQRSAGRKG